MTNNIPFKHCTIPEHVGCRLFFVYLPSSTYTFQRINPSSAIGKLEVN